MVGSGNEYSKVVQNVRLVTTMWNKMKMETQIEHRSLLAEILGRDDLWGKLIGEGAKVWPYMHTKESAWELLREVVPEDESPIAKLTLGIQHELVNEGLSLAQTDVGRIAYTELEELKQETVAKMSDLEEELETAIENEYSEQEDIKGEWEEKNEDLAHTENCQKELQVARVNDETVPISAEGYRRFRESMLEQHRKNRDIRLGVNQDEINVQDGVIEASLVSLIPEGQKYDPRNPFAEPGHFLTSTVTGGIQQNEAGDIKNSSELNFPQCSSPNLMVEKKKIRVPPPVPPPRRLSKGVIRREALSPKETALIFELEATSPKKPSQIFELEAPIQHQPPIIRKRVPSASHEIQPTSPKPRPESYIPYRPNLNPANPYGEDQELPGTEVQKLIEACKKGQLGVLTQYTVSCESKLLAKLRTPKQETLLHLAAKQGSGEIVRRLLPIIGDECVKVTDSEGRRPIHWAAILKHEDAVKLIAHWMQPQDIYFIDRDGGSPLAWAIFTKNIRNINEISKYHQRGMPVIAGAALEQIISHKDTEVIESFFRVCDTGDPTFWRSLTQLLNSILHLTFDTNTALENAKICFEEIQRPKERAGMALDLRKLARTNSSIIRRVDWAYRSYNRVLEGARIYFSHSRYVEPSLLSRIALFRRPQEGPYVAK
ncbi:hypothetical protein ABW20_dc0103092 [Dactylellina cionopaga]|nr:hypothetical protein ABW20_dc0103092 [Dactylellina cionopaga]